MQYFRTEMLRKLLILEITGGGRGVPEFPFREKCPTDLLLENHHSQRRQIYKQRLRVSVTRYCLRVDASVIAFVGPAVNACVAVKHFLPVSGLRNADAIPAPRNRREIERDDQRIVVVLTVAHID